MNQEVTERPEDWLRELVRQDLGLSKNVENNLRNLVREDLERTKVEEETRLVEGQKGVQAYIEEPGFWQQVKDISTIYLDPKLSMPLKAEATEALAEGLTLGNLEHIVNLAGKVIGKPDIWQEYQGWKEKAFKGRLGYRPGEEVRAFYKEPLKLLGMLAPLGAVLKGASVGAKALTKIPVLQSLARSTITGTTIGLARKPEEEGLLNRIKQVPGDVLFFTVFDLGLLSASQVAKMVNWNRAFKHYKGVKWGTWEDVPAVGGKKYTAEEMKDLFTKFRRNVSAKGVPKGLTAEETQIYESFKESGAWKQAAKEGWFSTLEGKVPTATYAEVAPIPRQPRLADIFREPTRLPRFEEARIERPFPRAEEAPPPPRPEAIPAPPMAAKAPPKVKVDVRPTAEGGWTYEFGIPEPEVAPEPGKIIPWKKIRPELPPHVKARVVTPRKAPTFKNPIYQAISVGGGIKPSTDYPFLNRLLPPSLYKKAGLGIDKMAQELSAEFPRITNADELYETLEETKRVGAKYRDVETGEELRVSAEDIESEYEAFKEKRLFDVEKRPTEELEGIRGDIKTDIETAEGFLAREEKPLEKIRLKEQVQGLKKELGLVDKELRTRVEKPIVEEPIEKIVKREKALIEGELAEGGFATEAEKIALQKDLSILEENPKKYFQKKIKDIQQDIDDMGTPLTANDRGRISFLNNLRERYKATYEKFFEPEKIEEPVFDKERIPAILDEIAETDPRLRKPDIRTEMEDALLTKYRPEMGAPENYIRSILAKRFTKEGIKKGVRPPEERLMPEMEKKVAAKVERPEDIFAKAEEEVRVRRVFDEVSKDKVDRDVLESRILKEQSYDEIGTRHGISRQAIEKRFRGLMEKVRGNKDVQEMIKSRMKKMNLGPIPSEQDLNDFVRFTKRYFTSTKGVDKNVDFVNDKRIRNKLAEEFGSTREGAELKKFLKKNKNEALNSFVLDALKGEVPIEETALPEDIKKLLKTMRNRIDKLSQLIISHGALVKETKAAFDAGLGKYIGKFYRLHQQKRWSPPKEVRERFKKMLKRDMPDRFGDFTEEELDSFIEGIINVERKHGFGTRKAKRVPTGHYKRRMKLSPEWKELAGEIHDPVWLYLKTISDQAAMAYNTEFLNKIYENYPDLWTKYYKTAAKNGWQEYKLQYGYGYGKLRGKYVHPELYKYIVGEIDPAISTIAKGLLTFVTHPFKATKTILSIPTQARNFFTNWSLSFLARNSIFNPANLPHYYKAQRVFRGRKDKYKKEWEELIRVGATEVQYYGSEIPKIQSDLMRLEPMDWWKKILDVMAVTPRLAIRRLGNLYNFNDALFRMSAYYKYTEVFKMSPKEAIKEIDVCLQNYRKLPEVVNVLRRWPLFGPFVSFHFNMAKIFGNNAYKAGKEMAKKGTRIEGMKRLLRLLFVVGTPFLAFKTANEVFDIDEKLVKRLEAFLPKYRRKGNYLYFRGRDKKLKALDLTYIWPVGEIEKAIKSLGTGDVEAFKNSIDLLSHPIFDAINILIEGRQPYWGTKVEGGFFGRMAEIVKLLWIPASAPIPSVKSLTESIKAGEFKPRAGAITTQQIKALISAWNQEPDRYGRVRVLSEEVKNFLTGFRTWNVEPDKLLMQTARNMRYEAQELKINFMNWLARNTKAPAWEINDKKEELLKPALKLTEKAKEIMELYKELKEGGFLLEKK